MWITHSGILHLSPWQWRLAAGHADVHPQKFTPTAQSNT